MLRIIKPSFFLKMWVPSDFLEFFKYCCSTKVGSLKGQFHDMGDIALEDFVRQILHVDFLKI